MPTTEIQVPIDVKILRGIAGAGILVGVCGGGFVVVRGVEQVGYVREALEANNYFSEVYQEVTADDLLTKEEQTRLNEAEAWAEKTYNRAMERDGGTEEIIGSIGAVLGSGAGFFAARDALRRMRRLSSEGK